MLSGNALWQGLTDPVAHFVQCGLGGLPVDTGIGNGNAVLELVVSKKGQTFKAEHEHSDLRTALDQLFHTMEGQLRRSKERDLDRRRVSTDIDSESQSAADSV